MPTATSLTSTLRDPRGSLRRAARRHRRPLAAVLAGVATLVALTALRGAPEAPSTSRTDAASASGASIPGHVTVPVVLASGAIGAVLRVGDIVDLVASAGVMTSEAATSDPATRDAVIARGARVVEVPAGGSAIGGSSSAVILVTLPEADALRVVTSMADALTPMIRSR